MKTPETPYLAIDQEILERNLRKMAGHLEKLEINLRPHVKTHKIPEIGKLQLKSGAVGITVATIGEAEVFAKRGFRDIFIAYPLWVTPEKLKRLKRLSRKTKLTLAIDSTSGAKQIAELAGTEVLVEIDSGHHRSGCKPDQAGEVGLSAKKHGLVPKGVFTFPGHSYKPKGKSSAVKDETSALKQAVAAFEEVGLVAQVISSGSTPSAKLTPKGLVNELRPGVYVFNDAQQIELGSCSFKDIALWANATVVSIEGRKVIVDAGSKILGADRAAWASGFGRLLDFPAARITALSEHHATIMFPAGSKIPKLGKVLRIIPNHVCNAVNLVDQVYLTSRGKLIGRWRVAARGKNS